MRAVIQRVTDAKVTVAGAVKGAIQGGMLVLLAVEEADTVEDLEWLSGKIVRLRIFDDENGVMNRSVQEVRGGILLISQFTLFASTKKRESSLLQPVGPAGNRHPDLRTVHQSSHPGPWPPDSNRRIRRAHGCQPHERWAGNDHH